MTQVTVNVRDPSPRHIVHQLLVECKGERDYAGMDAVMAAWAGPSPQQSFSKYCRTQSWTFDQVMALLEWQCKYIMGDGLDEKEFHAMWAVFRPIIKAQGLLDVQVARRILSGKIAPPKPRTRAATLEI